VKTRTEAVAKQIRDIIVCKASGELDRAVAACMDRLPDELLPELYTGSHFYMPPPDII
jgi:hypothetical protein